MASVSNGKRHVVKRKQTREKVCGLCLNANSCNMQNQNIYFGNLQSFPSPPPFSTEFSLLYVCCSIHHFGITKRKVMASKLQVTPTKLQVTPTKLQVTPTKLQVTPTTLQVTLTKLQVTPTKLQVTRSKLTSLTAEINKLISVD